MREFLYKVLSQGIYHICRPFILKRGSLRPVDQFEDYFNYEFKKAKKFERNFCIDYRSKIVLEIGSGLGGYLFHALSEGAGFVIGVDIGDAAVSRSVAFLNTKYKGTNYLVIKADAREMEKIKPDSVDVVVSDAVLEHVIGIDRVFREVERVLKPGGWAYFATSPLWYSPNGGHLKRYIPIPWAHLILPDDIIYKVLKLQLKRGIFPNDRIENIMYIYKTLGKLSIKKLKKEIGKSPLRLIEFRNVSNNHLKKLFIKLPFFEEVFAGTICLTMRKNGEEIS